MEGMKLQKEKLNDFLDGLRKEKYLFAPQKEGESLQFSPVSEESQVELDFQNTIIPPKNAVFPQTETLFTYQIGKLDIELPEEDRERVVLGIRPCDARAMEIIDRLFSWDEDDPYYFDKRNKAALIGLACLEPCINCFCTSFEDGGPASTAGLDVLMTAAEDIFILQPVTEKGEQLLSEQDLLETASDDEMKTVEKSHAEAAEKLQRKIDTEGIPQGLPGLWESPLWEKVSGSCLGCGICTYLCPTCHCFDIQDEVEGFDGRRCRMWDSCMFGEYTLHASGHNPRPTRRERTRNRINHKYAYFVDKFDVIACVGCGRCINYCPVNIDILNILAQVKEEL